MVSDKLWTPSGEVPIAERGVVAISKQDLQVLARFHEFAQRYGLCVVCPKCDHSLRGANDGHQTSASVACQCREFRFTQ